MAQLPGRCASSRDLAVERDGAADPGPDGEHHHIVEALRRTGRHLGDERHVAIVVDDDRPLQSALQVIGQRGARKIDVASRQHRPGQRVDPARNPHTDSGDARID